MFWGWLFEGVCSEECVLRVCLLRVCVLRVCGMMMFVCPKTACSDDAASVFVNPGIGLF